MATADIPQSGDVLAGKYVLREQLGEGGMGLVFRADQPALARSVAIKVLHPRLRCNEWIARRFADEAVAASRVQHPSSVSVIDCDLLGHAPFIVMEHVGGRPLGHILAEEVIPLPRALAIADQILEVLDAVHTAGVVHADVKSDNFLVEQRTDGDTVTLIDFGLARLDDSCVDTELVSGTPEYMAPELVRGQPPTPVSDLYGVAVILYELLTGTTPFGGGTTREILGRQLDDEVIPPSLRQPAREIPDALDAVVVRALAKDPAARFAGAAELRRALTRIVLPTRRSRPACRRCGSAVQSAARFCDRCGALLGSAPAPSNTRSEAPTRPHAAERVRFARGSDASALVRCDTSAATQRAIAHALVRGDVTAIGDGYIALADLLVREQRIPDAIRELEEALDVLAASDLPQDLVIVALAALYERVGERRKARHLLATTDRHDTMASIRATRSRS